MLFGVGRAKHVPWTRPNPNDPLPSSAWTEEGQGNGCHRCRVCSPPPAATHPNANPKGPAPSSCTCRQGRHPIRRPASCLMMRNAETRTRCYAGRPCCQQAPGIFVQAARPLAAPSIRTRPRHGPTAMAVSTRRSGLHLAEQTLHIRLLVVPRVAKPEGGCKLNSKALFDRARLLGRQQ